MEKLKKIIKDLKGLSDSFIKKSTMMKYSELTEEERLAWIIYCNILNIRSENIESVITEIERNKK